MKGDTSMNRHQLQSETEIELEIHPMTCVSNTITEGGGELRGFIFFLSGETMKTFGGVWAEIRLDDGHLLRSEREGVMVEMKRLGIMKSHLESERELT